MMKDNLKAVALALSLVAGLIGMALLTVDTRAEVTVANGPASPSPGTGIVVTNTAATTPLDNGTGNTPYTSVTIQNCSAGFQAASPTPVCALTTNQTIYVRLFCTNEPVVAASAASGTTSFLIGPGEYATFTFRTNECNPQYGPGYSRVSMVTASGTARATIVSK